MSALHIIIASSAVCTVTSIALIYILLRKPGDDSDRPDSRLRPGDIPREKKRSDDRPRRRRKYARRNPSLAQLGGLPPVKE